MGIDMYSEKDVLEINRRINRYRLALIPVVAALLALAALGYVWRVKPLALGALALAAVAAIFGFVFYLWPCMRYRGFLKDMSEGLSREMVGKVVSVSDAIEPQDGARVHHVHILLSAEQDERIIYINDSKRDRLPPVGTEARFILFGRHIRDIAPVQ